jgi:hypothetical protein
MRSKTKQCVALAILLVGSLVTSETIAAECGQAKLVEAGSVGVNITKNSCDKARLNIGSVVELSAGSRMWVKFDTTKGEDVQLICQNKSAEAVSVNMASATSPWIKPQGLKNCDKWSNNKLSCESANGEKNSFFCAIASAKSATQKLEVTTSVKMRGLDLPNQITDEQIAKSIESEIKLCKSLYNITDSLEVSWRKASGDRIQELNVKSENKDLISCIEGVVNQANASKDTTITHTY